LTAKRHLARLGLLGVALVLGSSGVLRAQAAPAAETKPNPETKPAAEGTPVLLDHVIGIINGDVLLESDVQEEVRYAALQPYASAAGDDSRMAAAERLVNRTLILQQMNDPQQRLKVPEPSQQEVLQRVDELKKQIPACVRYHCGTAEGWHNFLAANGFTEQQVEARWRERLRILKFIEARFRAGIRVPHSEIETYYEKHLLPQFEKEKVTPPPLNTIESRIEEILLQEKVNVLLQDWLKSLRDQGDVLVLDPSYGIRNPSGQDDPGGVA